MTGVGSVEAVIAAVREDARGEAERIARDADAVIARLRREDAAAPVVVADAEARMAAARREARARTADEDWADRQSALLARDRWMAAVVDAAARRLQARPPDERRADLAALAREALDHLTATECEILVAPEDAGALDGAWLRAVEAATGRRIAVVVFAEIGGGCVGQTADRRIRFDNTYRARARRFESEWRRALGALFDRLVPVHA